VTAERVARLEGQVRELTAQLRLSQAREEVARLLGGAAPPSAQGEPARRPRQRRGRRRGGRRPRRRAAGPERPGAGRGHRQARGLRAQRGRRQREAAARQVEVSASGAARQAGLSACAAAAALGVSARTLRRWSGRAEGAAPRGRPVRRASRAERQAVLSWLVEIGGRVGVAALRVRFPELPAAELADLLRRFKASWGERHGELACALRWTRAGSVWAVDFVKPPQRVAGQYGRVLAIRDLGSGMQLAWEAVADESAASATGVLRRVAAAEGAPLVVKNDNGSAFRSGLWREWLAGMGSRVLYSPAYRPGYNGSVEAGNKSLKRRTEALAAAAGRPGECRAEDLEAARQEANARGRPRGAKVAPAVAWECRERVSAEERERLGEQLEAEGRAVREEAGQQEEGRSEGGVWRSAFRRALVALGYLVLRWRRIPLDFTRR
jgi:transposase InsO family protein